MEVTAQNKVLCGFVKQRKETVLIIILHIGLGVGNGVPSLKLIYIT